MAVAGHAPAALGSGPAGGSFLGGFRTRKPKKPRPTRTPRPGIAGTIMASPGQTGPPAPSESPGTGELFSFLASLNQPQAPAPTSYDPNTPYNQAYGVGMDGARSNIENMLGNAMTEINNREAGSNAALATMPGRLNDIYASSGNTVNTLAADAANTQQNANLSSFMPTGAEYAPLQAAQATSLASRQADVPLLQTGLGNMYSLQRQSAQQAHDQSLADIAAQESDNARQDAQRQQDRQWSLEDRDFAAQQDEAAKQEKEDAARPHFGQDYVGLDRGESLAGFDPQFAASIKAGTHGKSSTAYSQAISAFRDIRGSGGVLSGHRIRDKVNQLLHDFPNQAGAISLALMDAGF